MRPGTTASNNRAHSRSKERAQIMKATSPYNQVANTLSSQKLRMKNLQKVARV